MNSIATQTFGVPLGIDSVPTATPLPLVSGKWLDLRQEDETTSSLQTCALVQGEEALLTVTCPSECTTSDSYYGCADYFYTTCYTSGDAACTDNQTDGTTCCEQTEFPNCATILKPDGGTTYTQFECFQQLDGLWTAEPPPYDTTETSTSPLTDTASTTASAATSATSAPPPGDPGAGSSSSNAGPIAGGVVGGVAALGVAGAAFWFFRRRKQQKAKAAAATATQGEYSELPKTSPTTKPESQQLFEMEDQRQGVGVARHELPPQQGVVEAPGDERREPVELP